MDFEAGDISIGKVLFEKDSLYYIPRYQRPYTWGEEKVSEFWEDIINDATKVFEDLTKEAQNDKPD